jgi:uncharacterized protein (DUF302 family)
MTYTIQTTVDAPFEDVIERTEAALADEGFGVLSDIDLGGTIETKLGEEFPRYRILGACNPPAAYDALTTDIDVGALLPCNVVVRETEDGDVVVAAVDPIELLEVTESDLDDVASDIRARLVRVLETLEDSE